MPPSLHPVGGRSTSEGEHNDKPPKARTPSPITEAHIRPVLLSEEGTGTGLNQSHSMRSQQNKAPRVSAVGGHNGLGIAPAC